MKKPETLPDNYGMTIAEINGRFYPLRTEWEKDVERFGQDVQLSFHPQMHWEDILDRSIPYAQGRQPTHGVISFRTRREALDFCHRYHEQFSVLRECRELVAQSELYPERNAWYQVEMARYITWGPRINPSGTTIHASVFLHRMYRGSNESDYCSVMATDIDDAYEKLYEAVCQRLLLVQSA